MKWIGLTGGLASGKSTVAQLFVKKGFFVIDADELARAAVVKGSEGFQQVIQTFGQDLVDSLGEIDRQKLAAQVFKSKSDLESLEKIIHPLVQKEVQKQKNILLKNGARLAFYDVPLLYEKKLQDQFDSVVVVGCDLETQKKRATIRNGWTLEQIEARLRSQVPLSEKMKIADHVILNQGSLIDLEKNVDEYLKKL